MELVLNFSENDICSETTLENFEFEKSAQSFEVLIFFSLVYIILIWIADPKPQIYCLQASKSSVQFFVMMKILTQMMKNEVPQNHPKSILDSPGASRTSKNINLKLRRQSRKSLKNVKTISKMTLMTPSILIFPMLAHVWRDARGHYSLFLY